MNTKSGNRPAHPFTVDETTVRGTAAFVTVFAAAILFTQLWWFAAYLVVDFFFRAFTRIKPPFALSAFYIARLAGIKPKPIYAPPKKFAALVGFVFSLTITALLLLNQNFAASAVTVVLLICAVLESVLGICVGCLVYDRLVAPFLNHKK
jgi:hypothetical protein